MLILTLTRVSRRETNATFPTLRAAPLFYRASPNLLLHLVLPTSLPVPLILHAQVLRLLHLLTTDGIIDAVGPLHLEHTNRTHVLPLTVQPTVRCIPILESRLRLTPRAIHSTTPELAARTPILLAFPTVLTRLDGAGQTKLVLFARSTVACVFVLGILPTAIALMFGPLF